MGTGIARASRRGKTSFGFWGPPAEALRGEFVGRSSEARGGMGDEGDWVPLPVSGHAPAQCKQIYYSGMKRRKLGDIAHVGELNNEGRTRRLNDLPDPTRVPRIARFCPSWAGTVGHRINDRWHSSLVDTGAVSLPLQYLRLPDRGFTHLCKACSFLGQRRPPERSG